MGKGRGLVEERMNVGGYINYVCISGNVFSEVVEFVEN